MKKSFVLVLALLGLVLFVQTASAVPRPQPPTFPNPPTVPPEGPIQSPK